MLKKNIIFIIALLVVFCNLSFAQERQIYIVGSDGNNAVYWLNGRQTVLPKSSGQASASDISISGSNIYIVGSDGNNAVYWLNGRQTVLPKSSGQAIANGIAISSSNIYIVGSDGNNAVYWLNGRQTVLPKSSGQAVASTIAVSGSNIYIGGYYGYRTEAAYWLNGRQTVLSQLDWGDLSWAVGGGSVNAIAISGSNIHLVGNDRLSGEFYNDKSVHWLNGNIVELSGSGLANANAIIISSSDVYIVGYDGVFMRESWQSSCNAVYWLNGERNILPSSDESTESKANGIAIIE